MLRGSRLQMCCQADGRFLEEKTPRTMECKTMAGYHWEKCKTERSKDKRYSHQASNVYSLCECQEYLREEQCLYKLRSSLIFKHSTHHREGKSSIRFVKNLNVTTHVDAIGLLPTPQNITSNIQHF